MHGGEEAVMLFAVGFRLRDIRLCIDPIYTVHATLTGFFYPRVVVARGTTAATLWLGMHACQSQLISHRHYDAPISIGGAL